MAIGTYAELVTAGENWIGRSDLTDRWPEFIALAEGIINRVLDCREMKARTASFAIDAETETLPTRFGGVKSFRLNTNPRTKLEYVEPDAFDDLLDAAATEGVGRPRHYTIIGDSFVFGPSPDTAYTATLVYRLKVPALTSVATTNWLLTAYPDIYLHGVLAFAHQYVEDDAEQAKFMADFLGGLAQINADDNRHSYGSSPRRRMRAFN